jgi:hypothetical protein
MRDQVGHARRRLNEAESAREQLVRDADDPELNLVYGRFVCFQQGDWPRGLPYLVRGSNDSLRRAAQLDVEDPKDPELQVAVADAWYEAASAVDRVDRTSVLQRMLYWARKAAPSRTGLARVDLEKRIEEVQRELPPRFDESEAPSPDSRTADASTGEPSFTPPASLRGLLGRVHLNRQDMGVAWKYECGLPLTQTNILEILQQPEVLQRAAVGSAMSRGAGTLRIEFLGLLHVPGATEVTVFHRGGSPGSGQLALAVDGRKVCEVGGPHPTDANVKLKLDAGEHRIQWLLAGTDLGRCQLQFVDTKSGTPVPVYHTQGMQLAIRRTPFPVTVNVNMRRDSTASPLP